MAEPAAVPVPSAFDEPYEVMRVERKTPTILELELQPRGDSLAYLPGEYVLLENDLHVLPPRSYSVANAPRPDGMISLLVTRVAGGATSRWVHDRLRVGDTVRISGPYGTFVDHPGSTGPALYLAAGSGLAPIRALLETELRSGARSSLMLIVSARTEADVIDRARFERWQAEHERFRFIPTLTRDPGASPRGRIPGLLPRLQPDLSDHDVFIAGAPGFVTACAVAADARSARHERVHAEAFFVEPQPWTGEPMSMERRT